VSKADNNMQAEEQKASRLAVAAVLLAVGGLLWSVLMMGAGQFFHIAAGHLSGTKALVALLGPVALFAAVVLGLLVLNKTKKSAQKPTSWNLSIAAIGISTDGLVLAFLSFATAPFVREWDRKLRLRTECQNKLHALGVALQCYADIDNQNYPSPDKWCDLLVEGDYMLKGPKLFLCNRWADGPSHYAMNPNAEPNSPPDTVLLFETNAGWNQFGGPEILTTENHITEGSNILFNDGSVRFIKTRYLPKLKWQVQDTNSG
jgi:hypothetical protein